jgi:hypothetical protein
MEAVNEALVAGQLNAKLPWIKREAVIALSKRYDTEEAAMTGIAEALSGFYAKQALAAPDADIAAVQRIYNRNMFPHMRARWDAYPDNRGHFINTGCFRCHGSDLRTADGRRISNDCNLCHTIVSQGFVAALGDTLLASGMRFKHPVDIDEAWTEMACFECHAGDDGLY